MASDAEGQRRGPAWHIAAWQDGGIETAWSGGLPQCLKWLLRDNADDVLALRLEDTSETALRPYTTSRLHSCFIWPTFRSDSTIRDHPLRSPSRPCLQHPYPRGHGRARANLATKSRAPTAASRLLFHSVLAATDRCTARRATRVDAAAPGQTFHPTLGMPRAGEANRACRSGPTIGPPPAKRRPSLRWS